jgi:hypothetical protein
VLHPTAAAKGASGTGPPASLIRRQARVTRSLAVVTAPR